MPRGPRIHLSVSAETKKDLKGRKGFNASRFFETKYREEFLNEAGLKEKIELHQQELNKYKDRLLGIKTEKVITPSYDSKRCPNCQMFFNESITIRKKTHIYGSLYVCRQCSIEQKDLLEKQVAELKAREQKEKENDILPK